MRVDIGYELECGVGGPHPYPINTSLILIFLFTSPTHHPTPSRKVAHCDRKNIKTS